MENKKTNVLYKQWWFYVIVLLTIALVISIAFNVKNYKMLAAQNITVSDVNTTTTSAIQNESLDVSSEEESSEDEDIEIDEKALKSSSKAYTFKQIARNPEEYKGKAIKLTGKVVQVLYDGNTVDMRVDMTKDEYGLYDDTVYITYEATDGESKILEDDIITVWGICGGEYSYTSTMGTPVTLPLIYGYFVDIK